MKLNGMAGKGSGKLGSMVYATVRGAQIVRQYNPVVFNPNTEKQVVQRTRFALLTKLAAMMSDALVFQGRKAMVSNRNAFIKANSSKFNNNTNMLMFNDLDLSSGNVEASVYPTFSVNSQTHTMTITMVGGSTLFAGFGYAIIIVKDNYEGDNWVRSGLVSSGGAVSATTSIVLPTGEGYSDAYVIGFPMFYKDGATRASYAQDVMAADIDDDVSLALLYNRMAGLGDIRVYATKPLAKTT